MPSGGEESKRHQLRMGHQRSWLQSPTHCQGGFSDLPPGDSTACRVKRVCNTTLPNNGLVGLI